MPPRLTNHCASLPSAALPVIQQLVRHGLPAAGVST